MNSIRSVGELVSMALTSPTLWMAAIVVRLWFTSAYQAFRAKHRTASQWFELGVCVGFIGSFFDNLYWSIPWSLSFINHPSADPWFKNGVFANIPLRQVMGCFAGYCHARSFFQFVKDEEERELTNVRKSSISNPVSWLNRQMIYSTLAGIAYVALLIIVKEVMKNAWTTGDQ